MSKSHYSYPPDEFDVRGPEDAPVGVHREPRSGWSSVWPFLLVAVVCGGIAVGAVSFLSQDDGPPSTPVAEQSADAGAEGESGDGASEEEPTDGESEATEGEEDPADGESEGEEEEPAGEMPGDASKANLAASVAVFNDSAPGGSAGTAQATLQDEAGFSEVAAGNTTDAEAPQGLGGTYSANTVLYGADRADTATAVAEALGVSPENVIQSDNVTNHPSNAVWVVLTEAVG
ncbi:LytR C-terminal domain-containing protein [Isoptericola sp. NEAU-Y5]|uniref:LytR C-terminal domain-containing protein n=1 Tax=Isoptericola luteus TaxID=2879484 RepID=A0ABS7ZHF1_9MICO|nr:LytR C-terminal domain-containing protein [Isoptericola sp. NEAU-Y5]MCA5893034.1 LytR C-terminal domain-containing protein [Isoptericola sp. NEAU-Y5]